jgi:hypothetical protein
MIRRALRWVKYALCCERVVHLAHIDECASARQVECAQGSARHPLRDPPVYRAALADVSVYSISLDITTMTHRKLRYLIHHGVRMFDTAPLPAANAFFNILAKHAWAQTDLPLFIHLRLEGCTPDALDEITAKLKSAFGDRLVPAHSRLHTVTINELCGKVVVVSNRVGIDDDVFATHSVFRRRGQRGAVHRGTYTDDLIGVDPTVLNLVKCTSASLKDMMDAGVQFPLLTESILADAERQATRTTHSVCGNIVHLPCFEDCGIRVR